MLSITITAETITIVDRPSRWYTFGAIVLLLCALVIAAWIAYQVAAPRSATFDCNRARGTCELARGDQTRTVKLAELTGARVSAHHVSKVGTLYQLDLVVAGETRDLGRRTSHRTTTDEYQRAATAIDAFVARTQPAVTVSWVERVGFGETLPIALSAATFLFGGIVMLALWVCRLVVVDRIGRRVLLTRSGPLRSQRTREFPLDDVSALRGHSERGMSTIDLLFGQGEVWPLIEREPSSRPGLADARSALEQAFGRTVSQA